MSMYPIQNCPSIGQKLLSPHQPFRGGLLATFRALGDIQGTVKPLLVKARLAGCCGTAIEAGAWFEVVETLKGHKNT